MTLSGAIFATVTVGVVAEDQIANIENVIGGSKGDTITGDALANRIDGRGGSDILAGGDGRDFFVFSTAPSAGNIDHITDYNAAADTIELAQSVFAALPLGVLAVGAFKNIVSGVEDVDDRILYDSSTGALFYDADGSGSGAMVNFAVIDNRVALTYADFVIV